MSFSPPQIHVSKIRLQGSTVWFKSRISLPTNIEMDKWITRYWKEAKERGPRAPLVVDVERDKLRKF